MGSGTKLDLIDAFYQLKHRDIVPGEIHESYPGKNIYRKDPKLSGQTVQTEMSLHLRNRSD